MNFLQVGVRFSLILVFSGVMAFGANMVLDDNFAMELGRSTLAPTSPWKFSQSGTVTSPLQFIVVPVADPGATEDPITLDGASKAVGVVPYFSTDSGQQALSQTVLGFVKGQTYQVAFDAAQTWTGRVNAGVPTFTFSIGGVTLASFPLTSLPTPKSSNDPTAWVIFDTVFTAPTTGSEVVSLTFNGIPSGAAKDIVLDRIYVSAVVIPEPTTTALVAGGFLLMAIGWLRRWRPALK